MLRPEVAALLTVTLGAFVLIDLSTPWVVHRYSSPDYGWRYLLGGAMMGIVVGQMSLIAAWSAFAPARATVRFWGALLLLVSLSFLLLTGLHWVRIPVDFPTKLAFLGGFGIVCCGAAQLPLWMAARLFGWRFIRASDVEESQGRRKWQFRIKHVMVVTLLAALLLAAWQWGVVEILPTKLQRAMYFIVVYVLIMFNPLPSLPWIWIVFQPRRRLLVSVITGIAIAVMLTLTQQWVILPFRSFSAEEFLLILLVNICQGFTVAGVLLLFRWDGWRLSAIAFNP